jgi:magnesium-transporting ATPase (P-type)
VIIILLIAAGLSVYPGGTPAPIIVIIALACVFLGFIEEFRTEKALETREK